MADTERWAVVTSDHARHRYIANVLSRHPLVHALVVEPKSRNPSDNYQNDTEEGFLSRYFEAREVSEAAILSEGKDWNFAHPMLVLEAAKGEINDSSITRRLRGEGITHCLVFGASWLTAPWLEAFPDRLFNLHLGLSPHFRGTGTNFWPLYQGLPEYVGATIHRLDAGIDSGPILFHVRPEPELGDDAHSLGNKTIKKAARALLIQLDQLSRLPPVRQWHESNERSYKSKDFNAQALAVMLDRLKHGLMSAYVHDIKARASKVRLVAEFEPIA